jgi:hypothetical protein
MRQEKYLYLSACSEQSSSPRRTGKFALSRLRFQADLEILVQSSGISYEKSCGEELSIKVFGKRV